MNEFHIPVLLKESIKYLNIDPNGIYVDLTFGGGGHSKLILNKLTNGKLIAFDKDDDSSKLARSINNKNFIFIKSDFKNFSKKLNNLNISFVDGILADLGVSSYQIDTPKRGFAHRFDGPIDMRMDTLQEFDAKHIVNTYSTKNLAYIFKNYGDLKQSYSISKLLTVRRKIKPINTVSEMKNLLKKFALKGKENKFFSKIFQALRIEVNDELNALKTMLDTSLLKLRKDGRIVIISYHSLEDRIVKKFFKTGNFTGKVFTDIYGNIERKLMPLLKKVVKSSEKEINMNSRSRSARLRVGIRL